MNCSRQMPDVGEGLDGRSLPYVGLCRRRQGHTGMHRASSFGQVHDWSDGETRSRVKVAKHLPDPNGPAAQGTVR